MTLAHDIYTDSCGGRWLVKRDANGKAVHLSPLDCSTPLTTRSLTGWAALQEYLKDAGRFDLVRAALTPVAPLDPSNAPVTCPACGGTGVQMALMETCGMCDGRKTVTDADDWYRAHKFHAARWEGRSPYAERPKPAAPSLPLPDSTNALSTAPVEGPCPICKRTYCDHTPAERFEKDPRDWFAAKYRSPHSTKPSVGDTSPVPCPSCDEPLTVGADKCAHCGAQLAR